MKKFDLNIEKILENWETYHAIREIIANALDEQFLTQTNQIEIFQNGNNWHIRDYGRGINYKNLTQNENQEKLNNPSVIGKFGIGLKDALATFDRNGIKVFIKSKYGNITLNRIAKDGFKDIITLHATIEDSIDENFVGTEFILTGIEVDDIEKAKNLFLNLGTDKILESTKFGDIVLKDNGFANIYINGVKVAEEENFLFGYNITTLTSSIKKALNRERTNVGRSAYSDTIKKILLCSISDEVANHIAKDLQNINIGSAHDELSWIDVQEHAVKLLNMSGNVLFVTSNDLIFHKDMIDDATNRGINIITIPDNLKYKISGSIDMSGNEIIDLDSYVSNYNLSFDFDFIELSELSNEEKLVYRNCNSIIDIFGGFPNNVKEIKISNSMRKDIFSNSETLGLWNANSNQIIISRKALKDLSLFSGILIHELIHAKTGLEDVSRDFETELTKVIGKVVNAYISNKKSIWRFF